MEKTVYKINGIKYPSADRISSRISTLRRSMACTLLNRDACTVQQEEEWMKFFPTKTCAYCGKKATHLDHLHPMIRNNEPTGYGTDPGNLVPCCGKCNTPKGNMEWEDFMRSEKCEHTAIGTKTISESLEERVQIIKDFQKSMPAKCTSLSDDMKQQWSAQLSVLENELKKTEDMLKKMKIQLYGNAGITVTKRYKHNGSKSIISAEKSTDEFSGFKAYIKQKGMSSASSYCGYIRKIMKEMNIQSLDVMGSIIDEVINYCTTQINTATTEKDKKNYRDCRSALTKYKQYLN